MAQQKTVQFGIFPGSVDVEWRALQQVWQVADDLGFSSAWVPDHFYSGSGNPEGSCFEALTIVAAMAASIRNIRIGPMVLGNTYRHPALVANMAATLDHISGGRLNLGMGAGWMQSEHEGYGIALPGPRERLDRLDEALTVMKLLFTEHRANFKGKYYELNNALCEPKPIQKPYPRLVIGGAGEKRTLRVVARHADEWNGEVGPDGMKRKLDILHEHCRVVGRDPSEIDVSVLLRGEGEAKTTFDAMVRNGNLNIIADRDRLIAEGVPATELEDRLRETVYSQFLPMDPAKAIDRLNEYVAIGVTSFILLIRPPYDLAKLERFMSRVAPHVHA